MEREHCEPSIWPKRADFLTSGFVAQSESIRSTLSLRRGLSGANIDPAPASRIRASNSLCLPVEHLARPISATIVAAPRLPGQPHSARGLPRHLDGPCRARIHPQPWIYLDQPQRFHSSLWNPNPIEQDALPLEVRKVTILPKKPSGLEIRNRGNLRRKLQRAKGNDMRLQTEGTQRVYFHRPYGHFLHPANDLFQFRVNRNRIECHICDFNIF